MASCGADEHLVQAIAEPDDRLLDAAAGFDHSILESGPAFAVR